MKTIRVDDQTHAQFKAACALRGLDMKSAAIQALKTWIEQQAAARPAPPQPQEPAGD